MILEYAVVGRYMDFHYSTLLISFSIFSYGLKYDREHFPFKTVLSYIGKNLSVWIYVIHPFVIRLIDGMGMKSGLSEHDIFIIIIRPVSVLIVTIIIAFLINSADLRMTKSNGR